MKKNISRALKICSLGAAILFTVAVLQLFLFYPFLPDDSRIYGYYQEPDNSLDVVLMGASQIYSAYAPAQVYREYELTSYNYAIGYNPVSFWKSELQTIREHQSPQQIIIEISGCLYDDEELLHSGSRLHFLLDHMPFGKTKIQAVASLAESDRLSYFFPIIQHHNQRQELKEWKAAAKSRLQMVLRGYPILKGGTAYSGRLSAEGIRNVSGDTSRASLNPAYEAELRDFLDYCRRVKADNLLFIHAPQVVTDEESYLYYQRANAVAEIVQEYGFAYWDMQKDIDEIGLLIPDDYSDPEHLNINGQMKFSSYLGKILNETVTPRPQSEKNRAAWNISSEYGCHFRTLAVRSYQEQIPIALWESAETMRRIEEIRGA